MTDERDSLPHDVWADRGTFLNLAGGVEGGLVLAAMGLAWLLGIDLWPLIVFDVSVVWQSVLATIPLLALFAVTYRWPWGPLRRIKQILWDVMGPPLAQCRWYDLPLLAALAGLGEELLFRGVLQTGLAHWGGLGFGLITASVLFGLLHAVTPTYAILAGAIGLYLGALLILFEPPNLLTPIVVHAVYDLVAFVILRNDYRRRNLSAVNSPQ